MIAVLVLGFLMGMRHALEADHLAAVASLATRGTSVGAGVLRGAAWGLGHSITVIAVGGVCLLLGSAVPPSLARLLEAAVGLMLLVLGAQVFRRMRRERVHVHVHRHADGTVHLHAHRHGPEEPHGPEHQHRHAPGFPLRALLVGLVHGMAGSAALVLLLLPGLGARWLGLIYLALFGLGSILGMAALSAVVALPFRISARRFGGALRALEALVGLAAIGIGLRVLVLAWR